MRLAQSVTLLLLAACGHMTLLDIKTHQVIGILSELINKKVL